MWLTTVLSIINKLIDQLTYWEGKYDKVPSPEKTYEKDKQAFDRALATHDDKRIDVLLNDVLAPDRGDPGRQDGQIPAGR